MELLFAVIIIAIGGIARSWRIAVRFADNCKRRVHSEWYLQKMQKTHTLADDTEAVKKDRIQDTEPAVADNSTGEKADYRQ